MILNFLFKIWIFNFDFSTIISFLCGVFIGMIILLLIYALAVVSSIKTKNFIIKTEQDDLTTMEVKQMVVDAQTAFKDKSLRKDSSRFAHCEALSKDLAYAIAVRYYPKSKYPFFELSINEITMLTKYVTKRVEELLDHRGIRLIKKLKVSTIVSFTSKKKQIEESKAFKATISVGSTASKIKNVLNILNPLNWGRKLIVDNILNLILDKICLVIIAIVGEETYKIYSKKVFNTDVDIDTGTDAILDEVSESIKDAAKEMNEEVVYSNQTNNYKTKSKLLTKKDDSLVIVNTYNSFEPLKKCIKEKEGA